MIHNCRILERIPAIRAIGNHFAAEPTHHYGQGQPNTSHTYNTNCFSIQCMANELADQS